eukprot:114450_1
MASTRHTSISRKRSSRAVVGQTSCPPLSERRYRSKTPQPPGAAAANCNPNGNKKKRILQYRARKDSGSQQETEEELSDYVRATTPQPHIFTMQRSNSNSNNESIRTFSPMPMDNSMFTFVKTEFEPNMARIPMTHNQLPPPPSHSSKDEFNTTRIHHIAKPSRAIASARPRTSMTPEFGALLSPKQMEAKILSHYDEKETKATTKERKQKRKSKSKSKPKPFNDEDEFMEDSEVAAKALAYHRLFRNHEESEVDKIRFKCDELDWNLNTLQSNTDKDIRQITAKIHRVEHDMATQNELFLDGRRSCIVDSLESSIGAVMRNVESIKDALQTLDLRMSIINQRQHDIFKHIEQTKHLLKTNDSDKPLVLNALEDKVSSRRASLQSMSQMLRLQCTQSMSNSNSNSLILPAYDDNEDILHPQSVTNKKLMGHIRPDLLSAQDGVAIERTLTSIVEEHKHHHHKHVRSSIASGLSDHILSQIASETMLIHSDSEEEKEEEPKRKYSESYSLNVSASHVKNALTQIQEKQRTDSVSYDMSKESNVTYEREISRNDMDPLGLKDRRQTQQMLSPVHDDGDDNDDDSVSQLSIDSMSDLSQQDTFVVDGDTLQKALETQAQEEHKQQMIQLMNVNFVLQIVPNTFARISDYVMNECAPSYLLTIRNSTTSHDLFFKTSKIYSCKSNKSLILFKTQHQNTDDDDDDAIFTIDSSDNSDDHLAPMEDMSFGDNNIKKGIRYAGYFVYEAYPFPNLDKERQPSTLITPNYTHNPITPHLKPHTVLNAIDEKHKYDAPDLQFTELRLGAMSPSTVNKYRRQSLSTSSRRTSVVRRMSTEPSVTSLLDRALDEEHNNANYPWNDDLDDLIDVVIGFDVQLSVGDPELNSFKCYVQFSDYAQPTHYHTQLANRKLLKSFCNGGSDGLHLSHNELVATININHKHSIHPQIVADIGYSNNAMTNKPTMLKEPETFDID